MNERPDTDDNLIDVIVGDHREMQRAFRDYESGELGERQRGDLVAHIIAELARHDVAEEQYMYPAAREVLADGDEIAKHEIAEHGEAERVMKRLEGLTPADADFARLTRELIDDIRHHISDEERDLLPRLQDHCSPEQLQALGNQVLMAKRSAPTRPHPSAPDTPPANLLLAPGIGLIDKVRDALSGAR